MPKTEKSNGGRDQPHTPARTCTLEGVRHVAYQEVQLRGGRTLHFEGVVRHVGVEGDVLTRGLSGRRRRRGNDRRGD